MPLDERMELFRRLSLQSLNTAKGYASILQKETTDCHESPDEIEEWFEILMGKLKELHQLLDVLV